MRVHEEFSRYASTYGVYNVIQSKVAQKLVDDTQGEPQRILDLGCGNGTLFSKLTWNPMYFCGVDFSDEMLSLHPCPQHCELIQGDFNVPELFERFKPGQFDRIYSASALQWAHDLESVFSSIAALQTPVSLAIFTSGTFKTLYETAQIPAILKSADEVIAIAEHHFDAQYEVVRYVLEFDSVREMFRYIKRSGVSGGRRVLDISRTRALMKNYPLDYLEFEVVFITSV